MKPLLSSFALTSFNLSRWCGGAKGLSHSPRHPCADRAAVAQENGAAAPRVVLSEHFQARPHGLHRGHPCARKRDDERVLWRHFPLRAGPRFAQGNRALQVVHEPEHGQPHGAVCFGGGGVDHHGPALRVEPAHVQLSSARGVQQ
eukprot:CAMPEP_0171680182 /NCGR_PEP_ID=MMETSP0990-20121206/56684_1 /TAXON_ID=483369 /ORGANISM="non described non described, Strain CCMP2098" /LENGTH=144 /DNA_ID=CAMNT_0012267117 /DNA_START=269 /DNA_END=703 /DNA_ORIENTATION=-